MAIKKQSISFSKAIITKDEGSFIISEISKDSTDVYSLSKVLEEWIGVKDVKLTISKDADLPSEE